MSSAAAFLLAIGVDGLANFQVILLVPLRDGLGFDLTVYFYLSSKIPLITVIKAFSTLLPFKAEVYK